MCLDVVSKMSFHCVNNSWSLLRTLWPCFRFRTGNFLGRHRRDKHGRGPFKRGFTKHRWVRASPTPDPALPEIPVKLISRTIWHCEKLQAYETKSLTTKSIIDAKDRSVPAAR